ncbi:MAG TPA: hypothetical protein VLX92_08600, partial [Kofleriaceae bacterium]|nr:hypothetical protein [Kofleriaceae bacterium]
EINLIRVLRRAALALVLVIGWLFIAWENRFHITASVVFACLAYLAVIATVLNLWRTGASAVAPDQAGEQAWGRPIGPRGELEKEKRTLLKAIKEAEFDQQMGKLSQRDADAMIFTYRARAIEIYKELDRMDGEAREESVRDRIEREVKARLAVAEADKKGSKKAKRADRKKADDQADKAEDKADKAEGKAEARPAKPEPPVATAVEEPKEPEPEPAKEATT